MITEVAPASPLAPTTRERGPCVKLLITDLLYYAYKGTVGAHLGRGNGPEAEGEQEAAAAAEEEGGPVFYEDGKVVAP